MIDIHTHILPGIDDGAETLEESVAMAVVAAAGGTTAMVCTSHSGEWLEIGPQATMVAQMAPVQAAIGAAGVALHLWPGLEIFLTPETPAHLRAGRVWSLAGSRYLLVELPYEPWPPYAEQVLFQLQVDGYVPILAHPERYTAIQRDLGLMGRLAARGILGQVTAGAFAGRWGDTTRRTAVALTEQGLVQILASDAHSAAGHRRPDLDEGYRAVAALFDAPTAEFMAVTAPGLVLANADLAPDPHPAAPGRSLFGRLFGPRS